MYIVFDLRGNMISKLKTCVWIVSILVYTASPSSAATICTNGMTGEFCNEYDFAFNKPTRQKEAVETFTASLAVDNDNDTCTHPYVTDEPWWRVDLGRDVEVRGLVLYVDNSTADALKIFSIEVEADGAAVRKMCYTYNSSERLPVPSNIKCPNVIGRHVIITANHQQLSMHLCSAGVYGGCVPGTYGSYCTETCGHCKNSAPCNTVTGQCESGCDVGYTNTTCKDMCPFGTYGTNCGSTCGNCQNNATCNVFTGQCPNNGACDPGYQAGNCTQVCADGRWGDGCIECGHCKFFAPCDKFNGTCKNGCQPGYEYNTVDMSCTLKCDDGDWGDACAESCGKCHVPGQSIHGPCLKVNGTCEHGCAAGYKQTAGCNDECGDRTYGFNCTLTCGHCAMGENRTASPCNHVTGDCYSRCQFGWKGRLCTEPCANNEYGVDCKSECGNCKYGSRCDVRDGACPNGACADGYNVTDPTCKQECDEGYYGPSCSRQCPVNCAENCAVNPIKNETAIVCHRKCSHLDGMCTCKDGWIGSRCDEPCAIGYYDPKCSTPCGHCVTGSFCRQVDGWCPKGCLKEWCGDKCDISCKEETYTRPIGDIVGGTIGAVIGVGLIAAFTIWVVWRYRQDKSIAIRALASSMRNSFRRLSQRGADGIRRSVQRLSRRGKRGQDQRRLDADEQPTTDGGKGGHKHVTQMYECVKIHSNSIHEDTFPMLYLQLQEATADGRTLLHDSFQSFLEQRPKSSSKEQNGLANGSYYNVATEDVKLQLSGDANPKIPAFLPLGSNLSGFLLINESAASTGLWNHLQQRQIETIISVGKEASCTWRPGERLTIGPDVVECIDMQLHPCHRETKLVVSRQGTQGRRAVRHLELYFWSHNEAHPNIGTLLVFMDTFKGLHRSQRERSIIVNYISMHEQAVLFTLVASMLEILAESRKVDILRTVAIGGKAADAAVRTFEEFKFLHDVAFNYLSEKDKKNPSNRQQAPRNMRPTKQQVTADISPGYLHTQNGPNTRTQNFAPNYNNNTNPSVSSNQAYASSQRYLSQENDGRRPLREAGNYGRSREPVITTDPLPLSRPLQQRAQQQPMPQQRYVGMDSRSPSGQSRSQPAPVDKDRSFRPIETVPQQAAETSGYSGRPSESPRDPLADRTHHDPSRVRQNAQPAVLSEYSRLQPPHERVSPDCQRIQPNLQQQPRQQQQDSQHRQPRQQASWEASPGRPLQDDLSQRRTRDSSPGRSLEDRHLPRSQYAHGANQRQYPDQGPSRAERLNLGNDYDDGSSQIPSSSTIV